MCVCAHAGVRAWVCVCVCAHACVCVLVCVCVNVSSLFMLLSVREQFSCVYCVFVTVCLCHVSDCACQHICTVWIFNFEGLKFQG